MHASLAYMNGVGAADTAADGDVREQLSLLNTLLCSAGNGSPAAVVRNEGRPSLDKSKSQDERQAEEESQAETVSQPGGYKNDPDDATNPNEARERHFKKLNENQGPDR